MRLVTVFDTNAYVGSSTESVRKLARQESEVGVVALASVWPCLELLARLGGSDAGRAARAHESLIRLWAHCGYRTPDGPRLRIQEAGEAMLSRGLFLRTPNEPLLEVGFVADLVAAAVDGGSGSVLESHREELAAVRQRVAHEEASMGGVTVRGELAGPMSIALRTALSQPSALHIIAAGLIQALAEKLEINLEAVDTASAVHRVVTNFPVAMQFMRELILDGAGSGRIPGGENSTWDLKLTFHASLGASLQGVPSLLVTDDKRIRRAARSIGQPYRVATLVEYQTLLCDDAMLRERVDTLISTD